jgi:DNA-binding IclR family transcriptional regulator
VANANNWALNEGVTSDSESTVLRTLVRGLEVLDAVASGSGRATAKRIAESLGLRPSTCYHLLRTLRSEGYIVRIGGGRYDVGPRGGRMAHLLGLRYGPSPEVSALLSRLHNKTQETAYVCGWHHGDIVMLQFKAGTKALQVGQLDVGYGGDMHARASCKSVLAFLPREIVAAMFSGVELSQLTPKTVTGYRQLVRQLAQIRRQGFAVDEEEFHEGVCCVAAPFFGSTGDPVGSFTVSVPSPRFADARADLVAAVVEAATLATVMLQQGRLVLAEHSAPRNDRSDQAPLPL